MRVLVDTNIWSLALRRRPTKLGSRERALVAECKELVAEGRAVLLGLVRQELLSGIVERGHFEALSRRLRSFDDEPLSAEEYEQAADCFNRCRSRGVQGSVVDMLICAVALRREMAVFTQDTDFNRYAKLLRFKLHTPRK